MNIFPEELVVPERLKFVMSNITSFRVSGGYNIPDIHRVGDVTQIVWESKFKIYQDYINLYEQIYDKYGRDGLFRYEYLNNMCGCLRNYTKGGFGNEGLWLTPEDLPSPDYAGIKESYYPLPIPIELLDQFETIYTSHNSENTNHDIARRCRCRDIPLITGEVIYKIPVFKGKGDFNTIYLRKYCWERDLRIDIIDTELNKRWEKIRNPATPGRPVKLTGFSPEQKRVRQNIFNKLSQANKRYEAAKLSNNQSGAIIALIKLRELIDELSISTPGNIPDNWKWVMTEELRYIDSDNRHITITGTNDANIS